MAVAAKTTLYICAALVSGWVATALPVAAQSTDPQSTDPQSTDPQSTDPQSTDPEDEPSEDSDLQPTFDFSGDYAPKQWQVRSRNSDGGFRFDGMDADGTTASSLTLVGSDLGSTVSCQVTPQPDFCAPGFTALFVQIQVPDSSIIQFDWNYRTYDASPLFDPFGYVLPEFDSLGQLVKGRFVAITDPDGWTSQWGQFSVQVDANEFFAFQIGSIDNQFGRAVATVSQFSVTPVSPPTTSVPEPGSAIALTLSGLSLLALRRRSASR